MQGGTATAPLDGIRVLDLSRFHPGAFVTRLLADFGAEVIRVEQPGANDPLRFDRAMDVAFNRGKRAITLDLKHDAAPALLRRLVASVDVVLESARPGSLDARGMGYAQLSKEHPALIWCSITAFGQESPYADRPAHDLNFLGQSGLLAAIAGDALPPTPDGVLAVPVGALMATVGILVALEQRHRTGRGTQVDASILDAVSWLLQEDVTRASLGLARWGTAAGRRAYRCADGRLITIGASEPRTWGALCAALELPELVARLDDAEPGQTEMAALLTEIFATRDAADWLARLGPIGAAIAPVNTAAELVDDAHVQARMGIVALDPSEGSGEAPLVFANPLVLRDADGVHVHTATTPPVAVGADTDAVLASLGIAPDEIAALHASGAV